jgi:hypothetical protein
VAYPARHWRKRPKTLISGDSKIGSGAKPAEARHWMKRQWQVNGLQYCSDDDWKPCGWQSDGWRGLLVRLPASALRQQMSIAAMSQKLIHINSQSPVSGMLYLSNSDKK